jgi:hypothetical protein
VYLISPSTLLLAAVLSSPALYHGFVVRDQDVTSALIRFLIAVPVAVVMIAVLHALTSGYRKSKRTPVPEQPRSTDDDN